MSSNGKNLRWVGTRPVRPDGVDKVTGRAALRCGFRPAQHAGRKGSAKPPRPRPDPFHRHGEGGGPAGGQGGADERRPSPAFPGGSSLPARRWSTTGTCPRTSSRTRRRFTTGTRSRRVAAVDQGAADRALDLIEVDYEVLPHVIDPVAAMEPDAPILHDDLFTDGVDPEAGQALQRRQAGRGRTGRRRGRFRGSRHRGRARVRHQGGPPGLHRTPFVRGKRIGGRPAELWCTTQGQYTVRGYCAKLLGMDISKIRVTPSEIGGGFGGKTVVYLEPLALGLSRKACQPVKMTMSRTEVFRATGPTSGGNVRVKMGATRDGRITAAQAVLKYQAGAFGGSPVQPGCMCAFAPYDVANVDVTWWATTWSPTGPRSPRTGRRARPSPSTQWSRSSTSSPRPPAWTPSKFRLKNAAREGTKAAYGPRFGPVGLVKTLEAAKASEHYRTPLGPNQGRGVASGFWFNIGGETCANLHVGEDGSVALVAGTPDIGGSRASLSMMAAEELGIRARQGPADDQRHRVARLYLPHRGQPGHVRERDGRHRGGPVAHPGPSGSGPRKSGTSPVDACGVG